MPWQARPSLSRGLSTSGIFAVSVSGLPFRLNGPDDERNTMPETADMLSLTGSSRSRPPNATTLSADGNVELFQLPTVDQLLSAPSPVHSTPLASDFL